MPIQAFFSHRQSPEERELIVSHKDVKARAHWSARFREKRAL